MRGREKGLVFLSILLALLFIRLGWWQLSRLEERRVSNAAIAARLRAEPVELSALPTDPAVAGNRRVLITGEYDFYREMVATFRSRQGSPGVNVFTPLKRPGNDTAILVNRGWVYAADGATVDLSKWREPAPRGGIGYIRPFTGSPRESGDGNRIGALAYMTVAAMLPYPLAPYYVVLTSPGADKERTPPRLEMPSLGEGSHKSYAIQWFSFAAIALGGTFAFTRRRSGRTETGPRA